RNLTDKKRGNRPHISSSPPPLPKKARSKVQARKEAPDRKLKKKSTIVQPTKALFHKMILEVNAIVPKKDDLFMTPKILDYGSVSKMRYYRDFDDGSYFYLEDSGRKVYDNSIVDPLFDPIATPTSSGSFLAKLKSYLDELFGSILDENHIREDQITVRIDYISRERGGSRVQMKEDLRVELEDEILAFEGRVAAQIEYV
ncbi:hypothetical protein RYX36_019570, partial [Vicia faba]